MKSTITCELDTFHDASRGNAKKVSGGAGPEMGKYEAKNVTSEKPQALGNLQTTRVEGKKHSEVRRNGSQKIKPTITTTTTTIDGKESRLREAPGKEKQEEIQGGAKSLSVSSDEDERSQLPARVYEAPQFRPLKALAFRSDSRGSTTMIVSDITIVWVQTAETAEDALDLVQEQIAKAYGRSIGEICIEEFNAGGWDLYLQATRNSSMHSLYGNTSISDLKAYQIAQVERKLNTIMGIARNTSKKMIEQERKRYPKNTTAATERWKARDKLAVEQEREDADKRIAVLSGEIDMGRIFIARLEYWSTKLAEEDQVRIGDDANPIGVEIDVEEMETSVNNMLITWAKEDEENWYLPRQLASEKAERYRRLQIAELRDQRKMEERQSEDLEAFHYQLSTAPANERKRLTEEFHASLQAREDRYLAAERAIDVEAKRVEEEQMKETLERRAQGRTSAQKEFKEAVSAQSGSGTSEEDFETPISSETPISEEELARRESMRRASKVCLEKMERDRLEGPDDSVEDNDDNRGPAPPTIAPEDHPLLQQPPVRYRIRSEFDADVVSTDDEDIIEESEEEERSEETASVKEEEKEQKPLADTISSASQGLEDERTEEQRREHIRNTNKKFVEIMSKTCRYAVLMLLDDSSDLCHDDTIDEEYEMLAMADVAVNPEPEQKKEREARPAGVPKPPGTDERPQQRPTAKPEEANKNGDAPNSDLKDKKKVMIARIRKIAYNIDRLTAWILGNEIGVAALGRILRQLDMACITKDMASHNSKLVHAVASRELGENRSLRFRAGLYLAGVTAEFWKLQTDEGEEWTQVLDEVMELHDGENGYEAVLQSTRNALMHSYNGNSIPDTLRTTVIGVQLPTKHLGEIPNCIEGPEKDLGPEITAIRGWEMPAGMSRSDIDVTAGDMFLRTHSGVGGAELNPGASMPCRETFGQFRWTAGVGSRRRLRVQRLQGQSSNVRRAEYVGTATLDALVQAETRIKAETLVRSGFFATDLLTLHYLGDRSSDYIEYNLMKLYQMLYILMPMKDRRAVIPTRGSLELIDSRFHSHLGGGARNNVLFNNTGRGDEGCVFNGARVYPFEPNLQQTIYFHLSLETVPNDQYSEVIAIPSWVGRLPANQRERIMRLIVMMFLPAPLGIWCWELLTSVGVVKIVPHVAAISMSGLTSTEIHVLMPTTANSSRMPPAVAGIGAWDNHAQWVPVMDAPGGGYVPINFCVTQNIIGYPLLEFMDALISTPVTGQAQISEAEVTMAIDRIVEMQGWSAQAEVARKRVQLLTWRAAPLVINQYRAGMPVSVCQPAVNSGDDCGLMGERIFRLRGIIPCRPVETSYIFPQADPIVWTQLVLGVRVDKHLMRGQRIRSPNVMELWEAQMACRRMFMTTQIIYDALGLSVQGLNSALGGTNNVLLRNHFASLFDAHVELRSGVAVGSSSQVWKAHMLQYLGTRMHEDIDGMGILAYKQPHDSVQPMYSQVANLNANRFRFGIYQDQWLNFWMPEKVLDYSEPPLPGRDGIRFSCTAPNTLRNAGRPTGLAGMLMAWAPDMTSWVEYDHWFQEDNRERRQNRRCLMWMNRKVLAEGNPSVGMVMADAEGAANLPYSGDPVNVMACGVQAADAAMGRIDMNGDYCNKMDVWPIMNETNWSWIVFHPDMATRTLALNLYNSRTSQDVVSISRMSQAVTNENACGRGQSANPYQSLLQLRMVRELEAEEEN